MCGILGILNDSCDDLETITRTLIQVLHHRGPDHSGVWIDQAAGVALGHTRLSILDLSEGGHQPMASHGGRYIISYNGEVYNFSVLRRELEAKNYVFRGTSDTEIMLAAFEEWGIENSVKKFTGMFAFGLWDKITRTLYLVRDRIGKKPLYYGWNGETFLFASELKAITQFPGFKREINRPAIKSFMQFGYIPAPHSIYQNIYKLMPGCVLTLPLSFLKQPTGFSSLPDDQTARVCPQRYWHSADIVSQSLKRHSHFEEQDIIENFEKLLEDAVKIRMIADVPLGAMLSGGIDSSLIVSLMQKNTTQPIKTFTIGFEENEFNEALYARAVAQHLHTDHTEFTVSSKEALDVIPLITNQYDEPFSDSSQIPTYLVCKLARKHVTVCLSGDGGDEFFGGYHRHLIFSKIIRFNQWVPWSLRRLLSSSLRRVSPSRWSQIYAILCQGLHKPAKMGQVGDKIHKMARVIEQKDWQGIYLALVSHWSEIPSVVLGMNSGEEDPKAALAQTLRKIEGLDWTQWIMYWDAMTYLPDDIMTKVDRASMAVSLESRAPLLDHRVVEAAWGIPLNLKVSHRQGKVILRKILYKYVPQELIDRPKAGFSIPLHTWLRGPLRDWAEDLLSENRLRQQGFFNSTVIRQKWAQHLSGQKNWQHDLWDVLMFQGWFDACRTH